MKLGKVAVNSALRRLTVYPDTRYISVYCIILQLGEIRHLNSDVRYSHAVINKTGRLRVEENWELFKWKELADETLVPL